jgi:hypothetical protein
VDKHLYYLLAMKTLLFLLCTLANCSAQPFVHEAFFAPQVVAGPVTKNFITNQVVFAYAGSTVAITPTAGHSLIAYGGSDDLATLSISDGVNVWVQQVQTNATMAYATALVLATALNVAGTPLTVTLASSGSLSYPTIVVVEISGVSAFECPTLCGGISPPYTTSFTTTSSDGVFGVWESQTYNIVSVPTLNPGTVSGNQLERGAANNYDASWAWLNGGTGFASGMYTIDFNSGAPTINSGWSFFASIAFK